MVVSQMALRHLFKPFFLKLEIELTLSVTLVSEVQHGDLTSPYVMPGPGQG